MTTYNTYQEAKIAMPNACIIEDTDSGLFFEMPTREGTALAACGRFAEPRYYCMTVEAFLADGNKLVGGDVILCKRDEVITINPNMINTANLKCETDKGNFILRAAALETPFLQTGEDFEHSKTLNFIRDRLVEVHGEPKNLDYMHKLNNAIAFVERMEDPSKLCGSGTGKEEKPRRTKVEWGCVHYSEVVHYFDIAGSDLYYFPSSNAGKCNSLQDYIDNLQDDGDPCLYHRIETEITEREEFIEELTSIQKAIGDCHLSDFYDALYDSGKFKLVN